MKSNLLKMYGNKTIYMLGDTHYPRGCWNKFLKVIDEIKNNDDAIMLGFGDWIEGIIAEDPRYHPEETANTIKGARESLNMLSNQWDEFEKAITPIKDKIIGLHSGNHEGNITKRYSINELERICKRLNIQYLSDGTAINVLKFPNNEIKIQSSHGTGGGYLAGAAYNKLDKTSNYFEGMDIVAKGHTHKLGVNMSVQPLKFDSNTGELSDKKQYQCATGSFIGNYEKDNTSYGERKEYAPLPMGYIKVFIENGFITGVMAVPC